MSIEISDGFNFAMGEWLAGVTRLAVMALGLVTVAGIVICLYIVVSAWHERRMIR